MWALGRRSRLLFRLATPPVCVRGGEMGEMGEGGRAGVCVRWLRSQHLSSDILEAMTPLQEALVHTDSSPPDVLSAARSSMSRLLHLLLHQSDASSSLPSCGGDKCSLASRLGRGLVQLNTREHSSQSLVATLQQHFLVFTQRLHSAEVERRGLRLEVACLRQAGQSSAPCCQDPKDQGPAERFQRVCVELRKALDREHTAQKLLQEQSQSLAEAKREVRRKEQSLRILGKHLSALQQERRSLEDALHSAARSQDSLVSYMRTAESSYREARDSILQSQGSLVSKDRPLLLPRMHLEPAGTDRIMGGQHVVACQSLLATFSELWQAACSRIGALEQEVSAQKQHVSALRAELKDACLRESLALVPVAEPRSPDPASVLLRGPPSSLPPRAAKGPKKHPKKSRTGTPRL
ncbi:coiled-coil domain-containing protein 171-like [Osmerus eperlanus]|uniref:coiled-coil domain-containing protein 171-like n=1 Tax=Osmerus eperlanus TaxID=29151 RepID=UPI002E138D09